MQLSFCVGINELLNYFSAVQGFNTSQSFSLDFGCYFFLCPGDPIPLSVLLFKYDFTALAVCFGLFSCWKIKPFLNRLFPEITMVQWIKTCLYFSAVRIQSIHTILSTPLAEMQHQARTDHPSCYTEGRKYSFFHLSPSLPLTPAFGHKHFNISSLDLSLHNTLHSCWFQSLV